MKLSTHPTPKVAALLLGGALLLTGCSQAAAENQSEANPELSQADALEVTESWAKAADTGMSAAFATLRNDTELSIELVSVSDPENGTEMQVHEMAGSGESMVMQQMGEPLVIEAHSTAELAPGGDHIMYMGLNEPLVPAETSTLTLSFADGSSKDVDFAIRNYDGANESYHEDGQQGSADHSGDH
ncbi:copper chaperone PCu(A)C [Glutamicibacter uratoxydans]|uniref:copper chaperone PCu(A)C n=1 Tax=Glutamicibacter uratoxydans TaxID=43667 RepID=UPI003D6F2BCB